MPTRLVGPLLEFFDPEMDAAGITGAAGSVGHCLVAFRKFRAVIVVAFAVEAYFGSISRPRIDRAPRSSAARSAAPEPAVGSKTSVVSSINIEKKCRSIGSDF